MVNLATKDVRAIFFDQGGVIMGERKPDPEIREAYLKKIMEKLNINEDPDKLLDRLIRGEKEYKIWGMDSLIELPAAEIWKRWLMPEIPADKLNQIAEELTLYYFEAERTRFPDPDIKEVIIELKKRGYIIGVISNSWSKSLVHIELEGAGIDDIVDLVVLSSETGIRKPSKKIFQNALEKSNLEAGHAVYVGDQPNRDVAGPKDAGFALSVILRTNKLIPGSMENPEHKPDLIIEKLSDLLNIFEEK